jgi:hypothetical protein
MGLGLGCRPGQKPGLDALGRDLGAGKGVWVGSWQLWFIREMARFYV